MEITIPRDRGDERRVPVTPDGVAALVAAGHGVRVEAGAGAGAGHDDEAFARAGATLVWSREEAFGRGDLVLLLNRPTLEEAELVREGGALAGFLHLATAPAAVVEALARRRVSALALERYEVDGERPVLVTLSEVAGRLAPQLAARLLETRPGETRPGEPRPGEAAAPGRGVLLSGVPGVPAAEVVVLGAGTVGTEAARLFLALGAQVTALDAEVGRLRALERRLAGAGGRARLVHASRRTIHRSLSYADVVVGAVRVPGERAPVVVLEEDLDVMRPGAVLLDYSIDEGGCAATSRPTTLHDPVFEARGVLHCCLPNTTALVARTASHAISQAIVRALGPVRGDPAAAAAGPLASAAVLVSGRPRA
jgi:alanine dehydrogenase